MGRAKEGGRLRKIEYAPLPSQARFHKSTARFKGFSGPIGSGKSQALCQEAIKLSYLNPGRTGLLGAPTYPMLRDVTASTLLEILNRNRIPYDHNKAENLLVLKDTGSKILFRAVEEFDRLRGTNLAWFGVDELTYVQEDAWLVLEGRLRDPEAQRLCGFAVWTPKGYDWVYRRFVAQPVEGYEVIVASPFENRYLLAKVPDFYERLRRSYDTNYYRQEVLGEYLELAGSRVYHSFSRSVHIRQGVLQHDRPLLWSLDFNVDPLCSLVAQIHGETVWVLEEIVLSRAGTADATKEFLNRFPYHSAGVIIYGDATGGYSRTNGFSDYHVIKELLRRAGYKRIYFRVSRTNPPVRDRIALVNARLLDSAGEARLFVSPGCKELIKDLEEVSYKRDSCVIDKQRDPRRTHLSDALGYLLWQEFGRSCVAGEKGERLL